MRKVAIVGIGRLGGALAIALSRKGFDVAYLVHRSHDTAQNVSSQMANRPVLLDEPAKLGQHAPDLIIIATGDPQISVVAHELERSLLGKPTILHTSGSLSSSILRGLAGIGCSIGSIHPLISVSTFSAGDEVFQGSYFCVEGDETGYSAGVDIATALGGLPFSVDPDKKPLYHAAAVMACGHLTALIDIANAMMERCGIDGQDSKTILLPLIESTISNIESRGTSAALTGNFARADAETVARHIDAMRHKTDSETLEIYRLLGEISLRIAKRNGVDPDRIYEVRKLLMNAASSL
jgi:predicted short-subunit dehydrogenase-like oxidoreductase (DUF2520 family)